MEKALKLKKLLLLIIFMLSTVLILKPDACYADDTYTLTFGVDTTVDAAGHNFKLRVRVTGINLATYGGRPVENGYYEFVLTTLQKITVSNVPAGTSYTVTQPKEVTQYGIEHSQFEAVDGVYTKSGILNEDTTVTILNKPRNGIITLNVNTYNSEPGTFKIKAKVWQEVNGEKVYLDELTVIDIATIKPIEVTKSSEANTFEFYLDHNQNVYFASIPAYSHYEIVEELDDWWDLYNEYDSLKKTGGLINAFMTHPNLPGTVTLFANPYFNNVKKQSLVIKKETNIETDKKFKFLVSAHKEIYVEGNNTYFNDEEYYGPMRFSKNVTSFYGKTPTSEDDNFYYYDYDFSDYEKDCEYYDGEDDYYCVLTSDKGVYDGKTYNAKLRVYYSYGDIYYDGYLYYDSYSDFSNFAQKTGNEEYTFELGKDETLTLPISKEYNYKVYELDQNGNKITDGSAVSAGWKLKSASNTSGIYYLGSSLEEAVFVNEYKATGKLELKVDKVLTGKDLEDKQFSFELKDSEGTLLQTKQNNKNGKVIFDPISYDEKDIGKTYVFTINEVNDKKKNYIYDEHIETITVKIIDNKDGTLKAQIQNEKTITFNNSYDNPNVEEVKKEETSKTVDTGAKTNIIHYIIYISIASIIILIFSVISFYKKRRLS